MEPKNKKTWIHNKKKFVNTYIKVIFDSSIYQFALNQILGEILPNLNYCMEKCIETKWEIGIEY